MKWTFQLALYERAKIDERVFLIYGDVGAALFAKFKADFPTRCFNAGLCEQAMVSMAAGMAIAGLRPIVYTITPFLIERAFEQIKLDVDQMNLPVGLVGYSDDSAGPTHASPHRREIMECFPNINSIFPRTKTDVQWAIEGVDLDRPWFLGITTANR